MLKEKPLIQFLVLAIALYAAWFLAYELFFKPTGIIDYFITGNITTAITQLLTWFGYEPTSTIAKKVGETYIYVNHNPMPVIRVGAACNGLELLVLFSIFIICYPGNWKYKIVFAVIGNVLIHILNIVRNFVLTLMSIHKYPYFELFHRYIFIFIIYGVIFLLWMLWANKISQLPLTRENK